MYYKVNFSGFVIVNAESVQEAKEICEDDFIYKKIKYGAVELREDISLEFEFED